MTALLRLLAAALLLALPSSVWAEPQDGYVARDYEPSPAIWLLSDEDTTIYMFGTYHALPERLRWRSAEFDSILAEVDELVLETSDADASEQEGLGLAFAIGDEHVPVSDRLSPMARKRWLRVLSESGSNDFIDNLPPVLAMFSLGQFGESGVFASQRQYGVESIIEAEMLESGRPVSSIESSDDVAAALLGIDEKMVLAYIEWTFSRWNGASHTAAAVFGPADGDDPYVSEHRWATGVLDDEAMFDGSPFGREMQRVLLTDRNRAWAAWLEERLEQPGTILVAVGAGHLEGQDTVQDMLAERGLTVARIH